MRSVILLSEIHPRGLDYFNPVTQAEHWYGLLSAAERAALSDGKNTNFGAVLTFIAHRCEERGLTLIVRDWSHLDFTAVPYLAEPTYRLSTAEALNRRCELLQIATVRHPVDQWLSLQRIVSLHGRIALADFLRGYYRFAEHSAKMGFVRHEDFVCDPGRSMREICTRLHAPFDPEFEKNWHRYTKVTGYSVESSGTEIRKRPHVKVPPELLAEFAQNADYQYAIRLLGYRHFDE